MKPELISFDLCPFVQRSVITLLEKQVEFDITYIDLAKPPEWFLKISPFGKVPTLRTGDASIFESAVINEYLDDITPPSMHPADPLQRALNKSWIEFASEMLMTQYMYSIAPDETEFQTNLDKLKTQVQQLEAQLNEGPYFNGDGFSLIDAAFAPFFTRMALLESMIETKLFNQAPRIQSWSQKLTQKDSVIRSVKPDFDERFRDYLSTHNAYITKAAENVC